MKVSRKTNRLKPKAARDLRTEEEQPFGQGADLALATIVYQASIDQDVRHMRGMFERIAIIKNDIEFILMQRKPGGYRKPTDEQRQLSRIDKKDFGEWFSQIWTIPGASTKNHPAPFPLELAMRLVRMFSFHGDISQ